MADVLIPETLTSAFEAPAPHRPSHETNQDAVVAAGPCDVSAFLSRLASGDDLGAAARRAGTGLALTLPFAVATALQTRAAPRDVLVGALALPVGLALIALVGVSASTIGISLVSAPLTPTAAASIASRGLFRVGLLLCGLSPLTALWVASCPGLEALFCASLAVFVAGTSGIAAICRGLCLATAEPDGTVRLGALLVSVLFGMFALVVGLRIWLPVADVLLVSPFGGEL